MASIQTIIMTSAIVILLIILITIGINIRTAKKNQVWPPLIGNCPDYWLDLGKDGSQCVVNGKANNLGIATSPMNFNTAAYMGSAGTCAKYNWAIANKVSWDGITYGVPNPCIIKK